MKTTKTKTAYTMKRGSKNQSCNCCVCKQKMRAFAVVFRIREEKIGLYCSPACIDVEINNRG